MFGRTEKRGPDWGHDLIGKIVSQFHQTRDRLFEAVEHSKQSIADNEDEIRAINEHTGVLTVGVRQAENIIGQIEKILSVDGAAVAHHQV